MTSSTPFWRTCQIKKSVGSIFIFFVYFVCFVFCLSHLPKDRENILPPTLGNLPLLYGSLLLAAALITLLARALILLDLRLGLRFGLDSLGLRTKLISTGAVTHRFCSRVRTKAHQRPGTHNFISGIHSCGKLLRLGVVYREPVRKTSIFHVYKHEHEKIYTFSFFYFSIFLFLLFYSFESL